MRTVYNWLLMCVRFKKKIEFCFLSYSYIDCQEVFRFCKVGEILKNNISNWTKVDSFMWFGSVFQANLPVVIRCLVEGLRL